LFGGDQTGHTVVFPSVRVERTGRVQIKAPTGCEEQLEALRDCFAYPGYDATSVTLTRLKDVFITMPRGVCATADGILVDESTHVARKIDPSLADIGLISSSESAFAANGGTHVTEPIIHCFHGASAAYGHFLFDTLPMIALCQDAIRAGRLKVLMPSFPGWGSAVLEAFGIRSEHIVSAPNGVLLCDVALISETLAGLNTRLPNPALCRIPAKSLGLDVATRWGSPDMGSRIYLSRENQSNYSARCVENEQEVRATLRDRGFVILEPGNMAFRDQVTAINNASVIVGAHGSGFGNLLFARPGTTVIDLMPQDWIGFFAGKVGRPERWVFNVTAALDLDYTVILCRSRVYQHLPESDTSGLQKRGISAAVDLGLLRGII
jgi:capsular polysaccharide biosynthesis protein